MELVMQRLNEMEYFNVQIVEEQIHNRTGNKWEILTKVEYDRDVRKVTRYTGDLTVTHDGEFESDMQPLGDVEFRCL